MYVGDDQAVEGAIASLTPLTKLAIALALGWLLLRRV